MVLGTEDSTPLAFWVGVAPDAYLQLDDAVIVDTEVPGKGTVRISGIVQDSRARHEGASFDTDVFLIERGHPPGGATPWPPRSWPPGSSRRSCVPPLPGLRRFRARGKDRDEALYFDQMQRRVAGGAVP